MATKPEAGKNGPEPGENGSGKGTTDIETHSVGSDLKWTRRPCGGLIRDCKARFPWYASDFKDAFTKDTWQQCTASITFLFFACLSPAIAFGTIYDSETNGQMGVVEAILASAIAGIVYSLLSGQPLCILGGTGPNLAYTIAFYRATAGLGLDFLPTRVWQGLWCSLFTIIFAVTDSCALMQYVTRYVEDIFSALISVIFIVEAFKAVIASYDTCSEAGAFLTTMLCFGTYYLAINLKELKKKKFLNSGMRFTIANFAVITAIVIASCVSRLWAGRVDVEWLKVPEKLEPSYRPMGEPRPWLINPFGGQGLNDSGEVKDLPVWAIFFALPWGLGMALLNYLDQNLTSLVINRPTTAIKKPVGYHLDLMVLGVIIYPVVTMLGLPFPCAATVRSLTHLISLTTYEDRPIPGGGTQRVAASVIEQRWTPLMIHVLIALSLTLSSVLRNVPKGVLFGVFLYMGITSIAGNQLFDRVFLLMNFEPRTYPRLPYVTRLKIERLHAYTGIQFVCLAILFALKSVKSTAVAFPFFIALLVFIRRALSKIFTPEELAVLDAEDDLPPDPEHKKDEAADAKFEVDDLVRTTSKSSNGSKASDTSNKHSKVSVTPEAPQPRTNTGFGI
jgi:hypothetical protein